MIQMSASAYRDPMGGGGTREPMLSYERDARRLPTL